MVEPWKASGGWPSPGCPRPGTIQMSCTARPPRTQPKCSSPLIVTGCPLASRPVHSRRQEPTKRPKSMSLAACSPTGPVTCSADTSPAPLRVASMLPVIRRPPQEAYLPRSGSLAWWVPCPERYEWRVGRGIARGGRCRDPCQGGPPVQPRLVTSTVVATRPGTLLPEEAQLPGAGHRLGAVGRAQLAQDVADVLLGRLQRHHQLICDLLVRANSCTEPACPGQRLSTVQPGAVAHGLRSRSG